MNGLVGISDGMPADCAQSAQAYADGLFPMAVDPSRRTVGWFCPDPRAVLPLEAPQIPRSLRKAVRANTFRITVDTAFEAVVRACAGRDGAVQRPGGWINAEMLAWYPKMHAAGWAHSLEAWSGDRLVGGLYGMTLGAAFVGESMFHHVDNASKVAFVHLLARLRAGGFALLDSQMATDHMRRFGLVELARPTFLRRLTAAVAQPAHWTPPAAAVARELAALAGPAAADTEHPHG